MNRQKVLLIILLAILALALVYALRATPRQEKVAQSRAPASPRREAAKAPAGEGDTRVHLELLAREEEEFPGFERDIFRFRQPPPPPRPRLTVQPPPPPAVAPPPQVAVETPVTEAVQRELARFTFLGFLQKDGVKTIFLSSGEEIFTVKKGDRFGKEMNFLITELTPERLTIRQTNDPRPIMIPLVEQSPLSAAPGISPRQVPRPRVPSIRRPSFPPPPNGAPPPFEPVEPVEPVEPCDPVEPFEPVEVPPGNGVPMEELPAELNPPQDVAPSEVPND